MQANDQAASGSPTQQEVEVAQENEHLEAMEGEGYDEQEQDMYGTVSTALAEQRASKKRAQDDVKLLANRIALLKLEEKKAWKKIEETKKKATEIMVVRQRNQEGRAFKDQMRMQKDEEDRQRLQKNYEARMQQKDAIGFTKEVNMKKNRDEAERLKLERQQHEEMIAMQKKSDEIKAQTMKHEIQRQKEEQRELRSQEQHLKRQQQRLDLIRRINEENEKRIQIQTQVALLEQQEAEWIKKLQNTSQIQQQAFSELETALNGELVPRASAAGGQRQV